MLSTGGTGGRRRPHIPDKTKWELYETNNNKTTIFLSTSLEQEKYNEKSFSSVSELEISDDDDDICEKDKSIRRDTHHICNLNKVECSINQNLKYHHHVNDFIQYCATLDDRYKSYPTCILSLNKKQEKIR